jgi:hypothetical protein
MIPFKGRWMAAAALLLCASLPARAATLEAIEYYNAPLDHYFVTALADEVAKLDAGTFAGWQRTGQHFTVFDPALPVAGASAVCRFYGVPAAGLDSHFYSASPAECAAVRARFAGVWIEETDNAFGVFLPDTVTGQCPAGSVPIYRAWNGRTDSNHRYTTDAATLQSMITKGYTAEGYGPASMPVAMCSPSTDTAGGPPDVPPPPPSTPPPPPPKCALVRTMQTDPPVAGALVVLTASCDSNASSFAWSGCVSTTSTCRVRESTPGPHTYSVLARNSGGTSAPVSTTLQWLSSAPPAPGFCGEFPSYLLNDMDIDAQRAESASYSDSPGFAWNGAWTVRFIVPPGAFPSRVGRIQGADFNGQGIMHEATISTVACDFRATDPSGVNGPVARTSGTGITFLVTVDGSQPQYPMLQPGGTYYFNLRNYAPESGTISCPSTSRCDAFVDVLIPH